MIDPGVMDAAPPDTDTLPDVEEVLDGSEFETVPEADIEAALAAAEEETSASFGFADAPRTRKSKLGGEIPVDKKDLFTADGVGEVMADALDGFFAWCGAEKMDEKAYKASRRLFAYYLQVRAPDDAGKYQPELLLGMHLLAQVVPRLPQITEKTAPWYRRGWAWIKRDKSTDNE